MNAETRELLRVARCPNTSCVDGAIPSGPDPDGNWSAEQCQWCYERNKALDASREPVEIAQSPDKRLPSKIFHEIHREAEAALREDHKKGGAVRVYEYHLAEAAWRRGIQKPAMPESTALLREMRDAMVRYEMDVDSDAPTAHREMMRRVHAFLASEPAMPEGFIPYDGSGQPVRNDVVVEVMFRISDEERATREAQEWSWGNYSEPDDIIAYKVIHDPARLPDVPWEDYPEARWATLDETGRLRVWQAEPTYSHGAWGAKYSLPTVYVRCEMAHLDPARCKWERPASVAPEPEPCDLGTAIADIAKALQSQLFAQSENDIRDAWHWSWDGKLSAEQNLYDFFRMLDVHASRARQWEEYHNGFLCVVERVREKYIMPRIQQLLESMTPALPPVEPAMPEPVDDINSRRRELLATLIDALVLPGHSISAEDWADACLLTGRHCEPFLSAPPRPAVTLPEGFPWDAETREELSAWLYHGVSGQRSGSFFRASDQLARWLDQSPERGGQSDG